jgi:two-component system cell cycle response regulator DivK
VKEAGSESVKEVILIAEDDRVSRRLIETLLKPRGYRLLFAKDGHEAIQLATRERPSLVLMDLKLPGLSGYEAARALRSQPETAHIPIVALTAHALGKERQRAMAAGCQGYILKPISTRSFADQLSEHIR